MPQSPGVPVDSPSIFVVLNAASGSESADQTHETIAGVLEAAGRRHRILVAGPDGPLKRLAAQAVELAQGSPQGAMVVAAGGDGTINTVAQTVLDTAPALPFGVIAQGTFNYFARVHGLPLETEAATRLLLTARARPVQVGLVNDKVFLVNASLGLYPELLEDREAWKQRFGRSRPVAFLAGLVSLFGERRQLHIGLECDGVLHDVRTPTLFVGNNALQLERLGLPAAAALSEGQLVAVKLKPITTPALFGLLLRGALGQLGEAETVDSMAFSRMTVQRLRRGLPYRRGRIKAAVDGEIVWLKAPLVFRPSPHPLLLLSPEATGAEGQEGTEWR